ncbi:MAG: HAMP domain-containing sensor histidine kinase [Cyanobacteria bacterium P01_H01_bin.119]
MIRRVKWHSVSTRLSLILLGLTAGSLVGLGLVLDGSLRRFFVEDAKTQLTRSADVFREAASLTWGNAEMLQHLSSLTAKEGMMQTVIFDAEGQELIRGEDFHRAGVVELPADLIQNTLIDGPQAGQFQVPNDPAFPHWLYATAPVFLEQTEQPVGAIYLAMPLRQPREFARQLNNRVITIALIATGTSAIAALFLSRSITHPLFLLRSQAMKLRAGDYAARSQIRGKDELAELGTLLNDMAARLTQTLQSLQEQEAARRELVANVSHDLRTPLASLRLEIEAVLDGLVTGEQAQEYLQRANRETDFLTQLVEQLLFLAEAEAGTLQIESRAASAVAIAQECLSRMEPTAARAGTALHLTAAENLPKVWVDPALIGAVVLSLLDNAVKYAPSDKGIVVEVRSPVTDEGAGYVPLVVRDHGPGMAPAVLEQVTTRFYRANKARPKGSLGLGMAIAQQVSTLQNAILQIQSEPGEGTRITLLLPVYSSQKRDTDV